jgi:hypothetical protein
MGQQQQAVVGSALRRTILALTIAALMAVMMVAMAAPAFAAPGSPKYANGDPRENYHSYNQGTANAFYKTPGNQPCSYSC